jgi:trk system potassium uptake protein TrkA
MANVFENKKKVIIVGCGRLGCGLACLYYDRGYDVVIIDNDESAWNKLPLNFGGLKITADGSDLDTLRYVGIDLASTFFAVTENDNLNSFIAQIAARVFSVNDVYARFGDTDKDKLIQGFNIFGIYPFRLTMDSFEKMLDTNGEDGDVR